MNAGRLTHLALLRFHQDYNDKMDLNDLCQTFVTSRPKECRVSLANRWDYLNAHRCAEFYVDCSVCSALL